MYRSIRKNLNPTSLIAMVALFVSLGGISYAAATINGSSLVNKSVAGKKLKDKAVTGGKVKNDTLTGAQINESKLGKVPSAATADQATSAASATNAQNAVNAQSATSAQTAANATAIGDDTVSSSKVQDGTLTGQDVGRRAGTNSVNIANVAANACESHAVSIDPGDADMRDDAFAITFEQDWPTGLVFSPENSDSAGYVRINVCNVTGVAIDAGVKQFHWVAFDV
jgi:hypothetical protein